jgi:hypothetical protein
MKYIAYIVLVLGLQGCAGLDLAGAGPLVDVLETAVGKDEPTVKSGMTSRDAAYSSQYRSYVNAHKQGEQKPLLKLQAVPGKAIENLASVEVYAPQAAPTSKLAPPTPPKSAFVELVDSLGATAERIGRWVWLPWALADKSSEVTKHLSDNDVREEAIRSGERERVTSQALEAAAKPPLVVPVPETSPETAP